MSRTEIEMYQCQFIQDRSEIAQLKETITEAERLIEVAMVSLRGTHVFKALEDGLALVRRMKDGDV